MPSQVSCVGRAVLVLAASRFCTLANVLGSTAPLFYPVQLFFAGVWQVAWVSFITSCIVCLLAPRRCSNVPSLPLAALCKVSGGQPEPAALSTRAMYILYKGFGTALARVELRCSAKWALVALAASQPTVEFEDVSEPRLLVGLGKGCLFVCLHRDCGRVKGARDWGQTLLIVIVERGWCGSNTRSACQLFGTLVAPCKS